jgi:hypothetical protein
MAKQQILPPEEIKDKRENQAQQDARCEREIKGKPFPLDKDVTGKLAQPGNFGRERNDRPDHDQNNSEND